MSKEITATAKLAPELRASLFWELIWLWREKDVTGFVEAARGGIREWSGLDYLARFCGSCGISLWEIYNKVEQKLPE